VELFFDNLLRLCLSLILPHGASGRVVAELLIKSKGLIFLISFGIVVCVCTICTSVLPKSPQIQEGATETPEAIANYYAPGYMVAGLFQRSPFGGEKMLNTRVTAYFKDPLYYQGFGRWHLGMDIIPSSEYYKTDYAFKVTGQVVMYATCSGMASSLRDNSGANYIYLICDGGKYAVLFVHNNKNFIPLGNKARVIAGQPLAFMGSTGNSTGPHIHYAIRDLETQQYLNPLDFILR
jgi:hypothetical protein